jgi:hypothetical protein
MLMPVICPHCGIPGLSPVGDAKNATCWQCGHPLDAKPVYRADYSPQELLDLGVSRKFVEFVFLDPKPREFRNRCEPRDGGWACFVPEDVSAVYPLWSCNGDVVALWKRGDRLEFQRLCHDKPDPKYLGRSDQEVLLDLFLSVYEAQDWKAPDRALARLQELADIAGFKFLRELHDWHGRKGNADDFEERRKQFVAGLPLGKGE